MIHTVLSRASAHGCSQLKRQNLRVGGYTKNLFNYPRARAQPGCEVSCMGLNGLASLVCPWFIKASPTVEKAVSCYKVDRLVASLLSFRSVQSSLAVREFCAAGEECYKQGYGQHGRERTLIWCLMSCCRSASELLQLCEVSGPTLGFTMQEFSMVGGYMENLEKPQNCQKWGASGRLHRYGHLLGTIRYFHYCCKLVPKSWTSGSSINPLKVNDLTNTHSLVSLQWPGLSNQRMLFLTENCLQCPKWSPYKGRGAVSMPVCAKKEKQVLTKAYLQPAKTATTQ